MAKATFTNLANLDNPVQAVATINANFAEAKTALENTLSRDGSTPNSMSDELNMNGQKIIGLPAPTGDTEPARHGDIQTYVDDAESARDITVAAKEVVVTAESNVETIETNIEDIWADVQVYGTPAFYDIAIYAGGELSDSEEIFVFTAPRGFEIASGTSSGVASCGIAATAEATLTIKKGDTTIGTVVYDASELTGTVTFTDDVTFVAGDTMTITAQSSADSTLASVSISIIASRQP